MWLISGVAVAQAGSYSSESTPGLGDSMCHRCSHKKKKEKKKNEKGNFPFSTHLKREEMIILREVIEVHLSLQAER